MIDLAVKPEVVCDGVPKYLQHPVSEHGNCEGLSALDGAVK
jgi:hypothetical protein